MHLEHAVPGLERDRLAVLGDFGLEFGRTHALPLHVDGPRTGGHRAAATAAAATKPSPTAVAATAAATVALALALAATPVPAGLLPSLTTKPTAAAGSPPFRHGFNALFARESKAAMRTMRTAGGPASSTAAN
jgi:hypothetical protein